MVPSLAARPVVASGAAPCRALRKPRHGPDGRPLTSLVPMQDRRLPAARNSCISSVTIVRRGPSSPRRGASEGAHIVDKHTFRGMKLHPGGTVRVSDYGPGTIRGPREKAMWAG